ncbi:het domain-containing protein [Fusarium heterosporum]|uniref:Het domain-containing protein n=1 Tax=Fusarium heterosporum TaxID=42747 RepID=A0A8H5T1G7_FUSHE|nr:het domain-containing protein [Fusarium heterosporum]
MWGNGQDECSIALNGVSFKIRQNLWDALYYLRKHTTGTWYWIDAICINQKDVLERNQQVRMMHHIYFRAQTVVAWLGKRYDTYDATVSKLEQLSHCRPSSGGVQSQTASKLPQPDMLSTQEGKLAEELHRDSYWNRLGIIEEIGQAQRIQVCFGSAAAVDWDQFTLFIQQHPGVHNGLERLAQQRVNKHNGSATLLKLLQTNRNAECQDRKDKIYGLVGLASDARNFKIDYNKSLFQIWTDVMEFLNLQSLFEGEDITFVGGLVKSLLMGTNYSPLQQILRPYGPEDGDDTIITNINHYKAFKLKGAMLGVVIHVGPHPREIVSNLSAVDKWIERIQANY